MEDSTLPAELQQLEHDLLHRSLPGASDGLRQRVLDDVQTRLRIERRRSYWQFGIGVAATALLWLNLSLSVTQATNFGLQRDGNHRSVEAMAVEIRRLVPELSAQEARREAFLMQTTSRIVPYPSLPADYRAYRPKR